MDDSAVRSSSRRALGARPSLQSRLLAAIWSLLLRLWAATWSVRSEGVEAFDRDLERGRALLAVLWHGKYLALFPLMAARRILVFTSASPRGDVLAELCRRFGYRSARIEDHMRDASLDRMRRALAGEVGGAIVVDGPLGPYHQVKRGAITLAAEQGRALYPVSVAASRRKICASRWDRLEVPWLFSRVALVIGEPIRVPADTGRDEEPAWQERVGEALGVVDRRAEETIERWDRTGARRFRR